MKKTLLLSLALLVLALVFGTSSAQDDILHVDTTQDLGSISPYVYGVNADSVIKPDLMPKAQELGLKFSRLGGNRLDQQDLTAPTLDLFVLQARQMGAEPMPTVRLLNGSPEKAADIVRYANIEKGYNIRYWSIGNEPNFFEAVQHADSFTTEDLTKNWRAIAEAMLAVDPNIILVGPDISQYVVLNADPDHFQYLEGNLGGDPTDDLGKDWMQEFLKANGDLVGIVSIHRYPYPGAGGKSNAAATIDGLRANSKEWDTIIPNLRQVIHQAAGRDIPIGITEINSNSTPSSGGEAGLDSFYNAIWYADVLGRLIRQQVELVLYWDLRTTGNGFGLLGMNDPRPTYYTYIMYKQFGSELLESDSADPDVSVFAAKNSDGALTLMVVNLGPDEKTKTLKLDGFTISGDAQIWRLDKDHNAEQIESTDVSKGVTLPGQSVTLYILSGAK